jgi:beta-xylosidase
MRTVTTREPKPAFCRQSHVIRLRHVLASLLAPLCGYAAAEATPPTYDNPILYADYSDPDVIRFGTHYYLIASTFHFSPGIPLLESQDLVHWSIVGHALSRLGFHPSYDLPGPIDFSDATEHSQANYALGYRYASGIWAPAIRAHGGRLYIYFATPTEGIFMTSASQAAGPWDPPVKVIDQPGLEDPCPFWDEDGQAYLVHSRVGAGPLILHRMSADGKQVLDDGQVIVADPVRLPTLEGPKLYKRNGYYYIFAPFGGVAEGSQAVLRARTIHGPYEIRTVLSKGSTQIQGPHQGGYVETPSGAGWFIHFNSTGAYGRIVYLEPVRWADDWPIIGAPPGQPVQSYAAPDVGRTFPAVHPQTSDEFTRPTLGPQWEWNHNPVDSHWSLTERPGFLRLKALPATDLVGARNTLTQVLQGPTVALATKLTVAAMADGQRAGLAMFGRQPSWIGVVQSEGHRRLIYAAGGSETSGPALDAESVVLRMQVAAERVQYSYSLDGGKTYRELGSAAPMSFSWWKGVRPALFTFNTNPHAKRDGLADFDWLRVQPP